MFDYRKYFAPKDEKVLSVFRRASTDYAQVWICVNWKDAKGYGYMSKEKMVYHGRAEACFKFVYDNICGLDNPHRAYYGDYDELEKYCKRKASEEKNEYP